MTVESHTLKLESHHEGEMIDITEKVHKLVEKGKITNGIVLIFVPGSTGALTTIEYEPGLLQDFPTMLDRIAPRNIEYEHEKRWHDGNGRSHVRASLLGPDLTVPVQNSRLMLGTWQQIVFVELDVRPRDREIIVQFIGE